MNCFIGSHFVDIVFEILHQKPEFKEMSFDEQGETAVEIAKKFIQADLLPTPVQVEMVFNRKLAA